MEPITLALLLTPAFATALVLLIVQTIKPFKLFQSVDTRLIALIVSVILVVGATIGVGQTDWVSIFLALLTSLVVTSSAMGTYTVTFKAGDEEKKAAALKAAEDQAALAAALNASDGTGPV